MERTQQHLELPAEQENIFRTRGSCYWSESARASPRPNGFVLIQTKDKDQKISTLGAVKIRTCLELAPEAKLDSSMKAVTGYRYTPLKHSALLLAILITIGLLLATSSALAIIGGLFPVVGIVSLIMIGLGVIASTSVIVLMTLTFISEALTTKEERKQLLEMLWAAKNAPLHVVENNKDLPNHLNIYEYNRHDARKNTLIYLRNLPEILEDVSE